MLLLVLSMLVYFLAVYLLSVNIGFSDDFEEDEKQREFESLKIMLNAKAAAKLVYCRKFNKVELVNFFVTDDRVIISTDKDYYEIPGACILSAVTRRDEEIEPISRSFLRYLIGRAKSLLWSRQKKSAQYLVIGYKNKSKKYKIMTFHSSSIPESIIQCVDNLIT